MNTLIQLKAVLLFVAIFHVVFGLGLMFSVDFQKAAIAVYGATLEWSPANIYFIRIIGSFATVLGYLACMACRDPLAHKAIITGFVGFFILRNISRHLYAEELYAALGISPTANVVTSVFFGVQALLLAFLLWRASTASRAS